MNSELPVSEPPAPARGRGRQTALDMVRSLAAVGAVVAVIVLLVPREQGAIMQPLDVGALAQQSAADADFTLVVPDLPAEWRPNAARLNPDGPDDTLTWHVGYVTPAGRYAGLEVARDATPAWVDEQTSKGEVDPGSPDGDVVSLGGRDWRVLRSVDPERTSLVAVAGGVTTVVTGSADLVELSVLAERSVAAG